jgi:hypothetical protein
MNMPGFGAESCLGPTMGAYRGKAVYDRFPSEGGGGVMPQLGFQSDRIWARTGDAGRMGERSHMPFLAGFLPSQSVVSCSDRSLSERGRSQPAFGSLRSSHLTGSDVGNARLKARLLSHGLVAIR